METGANLQHTCTNSIGLPTEDRCECFPSHGGLFSLPAALVHSRGAVITTTSTVLLRSMTRSQQNPLVQSHYLPRRARPSQDEVVDMVIRGQYGNGAERFERLQREGWDSLNLQRERTAVAMGSALQDVKKLLNVPAGNTDFDVDIIVSLMNSSFSSGVPSLSGYQVVESGCFGTEEWSGLHEIDRPVEHHRKSHRDVCDSWDARLKFDPSINTAVKEAHQAEMK